MVKISIPSISLFVGDAALGVPQISYYARLGTPEGGVPYENFTCIIVVNLALKSLA